MKRSRPSAEPSIPSKTPLAPLRPSLRICETVTYDDYMFGDGPQEVENAKATDSKAVFLYHLGLRGLGPQNAALFRSIMDGARDGRSRLFANRDCLLPQFKNDRNVQAPYRSDMISGPAFDQEIANIFSASSGRLRNLYEMVSAVPGLDSWAIRWALNRALDGTPDEHGDEECTPQYPRLRPPTSSPLRSTARDRPGSRHADDRRISQSPTPALTPTTSAFSDAGSLQPSPCLSDPPDIGDFTLPCLSPLCGQASCVSTEITPLNGVKGAKASRPVSLMPPPVRPLLPKKSSRMNHDARIFPFANGGVAFRQSYSYDEVPIHVPRAESYDSPRTDMVEIRHRCSTYPLDHTTTKVFHRHYEDTSYRDDGNDAARQRDLRYWRTELANQHVPVIAAATHPRPVLHASASGVSRKRRRLTPSHSPPKHRTQSPLMPVATPATKLASPHRSVFLAQVLNF